MRPHCSSQQVGVGIVQRNAGGSDNNALASEEVLRCELLVPTRFELNLSFGCAELPEAFGFKRNDPGYGTSTPGDHNFFAQIGFLDGLRQQGLRIGEPVFPHAFISTRLLVTRIPGETLPIFSRR